MLKNAKSGIELTPSPTTKRKDSIAELLLAKHLKELGISFEREWRFHPQRKWRFDFALCTVNRDIPTSYAIEIDGGIWTNGRHTRGKGFEADLRKLNEALRFGWNVIRFTPNMIARAEDKVFLAELFETRQPFAANPPEQAQQQQMQEMFEELLLVADNGVLMHPVHLREFANRWQKALAQPATAKQEEGADEKP